jgi:hypothetical protein
MRNGEGVLTMSPDRGAAKGVEGADPTKTVVPLVPALIPAAAIPPVGVVAIAAAVCAGDERPNEERALPKAPASAPLATAKDAKASARYARMRKINEDMTPDPRKEKHRPPMRPAKREVATIFSGGSAIPRDQAPR